MSKTRLSIIPKFLPSAGEMGATILNHPWLEHRLGGPQTWPQSLRLSLRLLLNSNTPMFLWWGPDLIQFYNDAYRRTMVMDSPSKALGKSAVTRTDTAWVSIGPLVRAVMDGDSEVHGEDTLLPMQKAGRLEQLYWTYQFLPIDHEGEVGGVLALIRDVSLEHLENEQVRQESQNLLNLFEQSPGFFAVLRGEEHRYEFVNLEFRKLLDNRDVLGQSVLEAVPEAESQGFIALLNKVFRTGTTFVGKNMPFSLKQADGVTKVVHLDFTYSSLVDENGIAYGTFIEGRYSESENQPRPPESSLSRQESRVLHFLAVGMTAHEVAVAMQLSKRTVESYIQAAAQKLNTANSTHTVVEAIRRGVLKL